MSDQLAPADFEQALAASLAGFQQVLLDGIVAQLSRQEGRLAEQHALVEHLAELMRAGQPDPAAAPALQYVNRLRNNMAAHRLRLRLVEETVREDHARLDEFERRLFEMERRMFEMEVQRPSPRLLQESSAPGSPTAPISLPVQSLVRANGGQMPSA